jgi:hypothetical protein
MYLFLLCFGIVLSVAGVILAASGLSVHDHTFDLTLVTPGIVALAGGLLLIGLGFALRVLQRIEAAVAARPVVPRAMRVGEATEPGKAALGMAANVAANAELPSEPSRIPFPVKITRLPPSATAPAAVPFAPAAEKRMEDLPQKFPNVVRVGPAPAIEDVELSPRPLAPAALHASEENTDQNVGPFVLRTGKARNGVAPAAKISPRLDVGARAPLAPERPKGPAFDALWPKGPRRAAAQAKPVEAPATPVAAPDPVIEEEAIASSPAVTPDEAPEPITILKSGIVDGMAYTLYSDGSIEAQLPQGMLRFGSITELRAHIEQDSQISQDSQT